MRTDEKTNEDRAHERFLVRSAYLAAAAVLSFVIAGMVGCPSYNVWRQGLRGKAQLREAEWSRQIAVQEAKAKLDSAKHLADAEVARAEGVARANRIIGQSLHDNEAYLRYLWIQNLHESAGDVIYIPTEAGLPILEAGRFGTSKVAPAQ